MVSVAAGQENMLDEDEDEGCFFVLVSDSAHKCAFTFALTSL